MSRGAHRKPSLLPWWVILVVLVLGFVCCGGLVVVVGAGAIAGGSTINTQTAGNRLRPDAPVPPQYLAMVLAAGTLCPQIGPAEIAAQLNLESSWNPSAYTDSGEAPARGIAQFTDATWQTWGKDHDRDGVSSPYDPGDAILAQGHLMCDLVAWANQHLTAGRLRGDVLDLAWSAYFCGRGCVLAAGGVPAAGLAHDYPEQLRARLARYAAAPAGRGDWTLPLKPGTYRIGSGFGPRWGRLHAGVDLIAATGTPIYAIAAGTVLAAGCDSAYCDRPGYVGLNGCGLRINLSHGRGIVSRYCHAVRLAVATGQHVAAGQLIAWVGSTGNSSGPHLHFEIHRNAPPATSTNAIEPLSYLRSVGLNP
jgi:murein DD-endopeptidase MepM/ murein hydrolase activator NlpD